MGAFKTVPSPSLHARSGNSVVSVLGLISSGNSKISGQEKIMSIIARKHLEMD